FQAEDGIRDRTVTGVQTCALPISQMTPAVFALTNVEVEAGPGLFKAQGRVMKFDGYRRVLPPAGKQEDRTLPPLSQGQALDKVRSEERRVGKGRRGGGAGVEERKK